MRTAEELPLLIPKEYEAEPVFRPANLLREARRQRNLPDVEVPAVWLLDPDVDIARHLAASGRGAGIRGGPATTPRCGRSSCTPLTSGWAVWPWERRSRCWWPSSWRCPDATSWSA